MFFKKFFCMAMLLVMALSGCMGKNSEMEENGIKENRATSYSGSYSEVYFRGTPNSWGKTAMSLVSDYT